MQHTEPTCQRERIADKPPPPPILPSLKKNLEIKNSERKKAKRKKDGKKQEKDRKKERWQTAGKDRKTEIKIE